MKRARNLIGFSPGVDGVTFRIEADGFFSWEMILNGLFKVFSPRQRLVCAEDKE